MSFYAIFPAMNTASSPISETIDPFAIIQVKDQIIQKQNQLLDALQGKIILLEEQLAWFKKQIFGQKSERIVANLDSQPLLPELVIADPQAHEPEKENISYERNKVQKNKGSDTISFPDDLPVKRVELDIPESEKFCPESGEPLVCIGHDVSRKLGRSPEQFFIVEYVRPKYASKACPEYGVLSSALPDAVISRCPADESLLSYILTSKYADHLPLYRLVEILQRSQVKISRQTLSKWVITLGTALTPLHEAMKERVLKSGVIFADETPIDLQVQGKSRCQQAYLWIYAGGGGGDPPYRFFEFCLNRNHDHPMKTLKGYQGVLHSDKYGVYEKLAKTDGIIWCPCMAHVRRKFVEAEGGDPELRRHVLRWIKHLFMLERVAWSRDTDERLRIRRELEKPIVTKMTAAIKNRLLSGGLLPKSNFTKALNYYMGLAPYLPNYINHPDARLDNNVAERGLRPLTIGRKNWLFVGSEDSGRSAATILSLVQTCRNLGINPQEYLEDVLRRIMGHPVKKIDQLLPDNWLAAKQNSPA